MYSAVVTVLALASYVFAGPLTTDRPGGRIVNGVETSIDARPYQVSLQSKNGDHFCGGSIINEDTVLTAAHCMQSKYALETMVRLGSSKYNTQGELVAIRTFKNHPKYDTENHSNDVCVIKLASPVRQSSHLSFIALAKETPPTGTPAVVSGWGVKCFFFCQKAPEVLREVELKLVDRKVCASDKYKYGPSMVKKGMVCAIGDKKDSCQGDSGGPLVSKGQQVGVVSFGKYCAKPNYPGVYADVPYFREWILETAATL